MLASLTLLVTTLIPPQDSVGLTLTPRWSIGGAEDTAISFSRLAPDQIAADDRGMVYVVDSDRFRVLVLSTEGKIVRTMGRQGGGPGELGLPFSMAVSPNGVVAVYDATKRALVRFGTDGKPIAQLSLMDQGNVQRIYAENDSTYVFSTMLKDSAKVVRITGATPRVLFSAVLPERKSIMSKACRVSYGREAFFAPRLLWTASPQQVVVNADGSFELRSLGSAILLRREARRAGTSNAVLTQYYGEEEKISIGGARPCGIPVTEIVRETGMASTVPAYDRLLSLQHQIWAVRLVPKGVDRVADLYDARKGYLGSARLGRGNPAVLLPDARLVTVERDADDVLYLQTYAVKGLP